MKSKIESLSINDISIKTKMSENEVSNFLKLIKRSMEPFSKRIIVFEDNILRYYQVERRGIGILNTEYGKFWEYDFAIDDQWQKYSVIVKADMDEELLIPVLKNKDQLVLRTDSGCETGQLFSDLTCECKDQLRLALKTINDIGEGILISIPRQDGRGLGLTFKLATLWMQDVLGLNTVEVAALLAPGGIIDIRTYSGVICILKFFGISESCMINLATNNPKKAEIFSENNYSVSYTPIVIEPTKYTECHLHAKQDYLGHKNLIKKERGKNEIN